MASDYPFLLQAYSLLNPPPLLPLGGLHYVTLSHVPPHPHYSLFPPPTDFLEVPFKLVLSFTIKIIFPLKSSMKSSLKSMLSFMIQSYFRHACLESHEVRVIVNTPDLKSN